MSAIVELMAALIEVVVRLVALVVEALVSGVAHLATKPEEGESRFSGKRLLAACVPLFLVVVAIGGMFGFSHWRAEVRRARRDATRTLVEEQVDRLAEQVDERGHLVKHAARTLDAHDAWGNPLRVTYEKTLTHQVVVVRSAGDDEKLGTLYDISSSRRLLRPRQEIAIDLFDRVKGVIEDRIDDRE